MYPIIIIFLNSKLFVIFIYLFFFSELRETFRLLAFGAIFRRPFRVFRHSIML